METNAIRRLRFSSLWTTLDFEILSMTGECCQRSALDVLCVLRAPKEAVGIDEVVDDTREDGERDGGGSVKKLGKDL